MQSELEELLNKAKILLKDEMTEIAFNTWIKPLEIQSISNDTITLLDRTGYGITVYARSLIDESPANAPYLVYKGDFILLFIIFP